MDTSYKFAINRIQIEFEKQKEQNPKNKYIVLYRAIKQCIINSEIPHNWLLPSTRILAEEMNVSRTTVNKAYELLQLEKLIVAKLGSGSRVYYLPTSALVKEENTLEMVQNNYPSISKKGISYLENVSLINRPETNSLAFRPGLPPIDMFPVNQWKNLLNTYWRLIKSSDLSYSHSAGLSEFKKSIANYLNISRNIKCNHEQIVVVSGSLQSLFLITNSLINPDDTVVVEDPLFPNVHSVFKSSEANLVSVKLDKEGIDIKQLEGRKIENPKIIHVTPSNHYPLGIKMSLKRRQEILKWASSNSTLVIENDYENEIANSIDRIPSIFSLDTENRTIYMGTFNRLLHPSIRVGYMIVPKYLLNTVQALQEHSHRFVNPSTQVVMNQFIEKNYLFKHIRNVIAVAKERQSIFIDYFNENCNSMFIEKKTFSSFHILAFFKEETSSEQEQIIIKKLEKIGVIVFSLSKCYIQSPKKQGLIIGYSSLKINAMKQKIKKMSEII